LEENKMTVQLDFSLKSKDDLNYAKLLNAENISRIFFVENKVPDISKY
jgi:hypothetical protein